MPHYTPLISTIVVALVLAFIFGVMAQRLRFSPLVGYLVAGILISPFTPGFVADQGIANELAEIGVVLLMFGVGLHFSLEDLLSVGRIAIPGAIAQIAVATALGAGLAWWLGWSISAGVVFGLALSVASTVVLLRAMQERRLLETERGRIAVGWLIVEDMAMVLALVLLPALAPVLKAGASAELVRARPSDRDHAGQGRGVRRHHADRGQARDPLDPALRGAYRLARAVSPVRARHRARRRLRRGDAVRRVVRARRILRRHDAERIRAEPARGHPRRCPCATPSR